MGDSGTPDGTPPVYMTRAQQKRMERRRSRTFRSDDTATDDSAKSNSLDRGNNISGSVSTLNDEALSTTGTLESSVSDSTLDEISVLKKLYVPAPTH